MCILISENRVLLFLLLVSGNFFFFLAKITFLVLEVWGLFQAKNKILIYASPKTRPTLYILEYCQSSSLSMNPPYLQIKIDCSHEMVSAHCFTLISELHTLLIVFANVNFIIDILSSPS